MRFLFIKFKNYQTFKILLNYVYVGGFMHVSAMPVEVRRQCQIWNPSFQQL